jgi:ribosomal-protein-alanine N-acetyltransferase
MKEKFIIRRMTPEDLPGVLTVERACFTEPWSEASYRAALLQPYTTYYVAEAVVADLVPAEGTRSLTAAGSRIIATCGLYNLAGEGELTNVAVLPGWRGLGISRRLLERLFEELEDEIGDYTLEVRAGNLPAIRLYESFGFTAEGRRPGFYDRPREDALIYWKRRKKEDR